MKQIAVFGNTFRPAGLTSLKTLFDYFNDKGVRILLDREIFEYFKAIHSDYKIYKYVIDDDQFEADLALSIGGDGTFLTTASRIGSKGIPILGINTGRLGFLADIASEELEASLDSIAQMNLNIEERTLFEVSFSDGRKLEHPYFLNDAAILKHDTSSMISIRVSLNGEWIHNYQADGLIISTPTGSTAYSLSVGGPILTPDTQNMIITPVASHSLNDRPLVIPDDWKVDLEVNTRSKFYQIAMDGRNIVLDQDIELQIKKADFKIKVAKRLNKTFFDTLKDKMMWGVDRRVK